MVLVGHAAYPRVTRDRTPASLSKKWITDVLRKKIGYRGLVVSDDLEMGGVLKAAPIEQAAVKYVRAGGDLCLICHHRGIRLGVRTKRWSKRRSANRKFARRVEESAGRVLAFKNKSQELRREASVPYRRESAKTLAAVMGIQRAGAIGSASDGRASMAGAA